MENENLPKDFVNKHQSAFIIFLLLKLMIYNDTDAFILMLTVPSGKGKSRIVFVLGRSIQEYFYVKH